MKGGIKMGLIQDKVIQQMGEQMQSKMEDMLVKANEANQQTINLMEQIKELLKELQLCQNNNSVWMMNALQLICDKTGVVLADPLENENR